MQIIFSDNSVADLEIDDTPMGKVYQKVYKHLSRIPIPFKPWDNPWYRKNLSIEQLVKRLDTYAREVDVDIDMTRCLQQDQLYLNYLHKVYEDNYNGKPAWLDFHEHIHLVEQYHLPMFKVASIDYRHLAGPLEKPMDSSWMYPMSTKIRAGEVFTRWSELGKQPYHYWRDDEPDNIDRLCALSKPWLLLRPKIQIALGDINDIAQFDVTKFEPWWNRHRKDWCKHWNQPDCTVEQMFSSVVFGRVKNYELVVDNLKNNIVPAQIKII
jgi:hypothetical protein